MIMLNAKEVLEKKIQMLKLFLSTNNCKMLFFHIYLFI